MNMFAKRISLVLLLCAALASAAFALHPMKVFLLRGNRGRLAPEVEGHFYLAVSGSNDFHHVKHAHKHWLPWLPTIQAHHLKSPHRGFHGEVHAGLHLRPGAVGAIVEAFKARIKHGLTQAVEKRHPCHEALLQLGCVDKLEDTVHVDALLFQLTRCVVKEAKANQFRLEAQCKAAVKDTLYSSCDKEIEDMCSSVTPGAGRVKLCLLHKFRVRSSSFRTSCHEAIKPKTNAHHDLGKKTHFIQDFIDHEHEHKSRREAAPRPYAKKTTEQNAPRQEMGQSAKAGETQPTVFVQNQQIHVHVALLIAGAGIVLVALFVVVTRSVHKMWRRKSMERSQQKAQLLVKTVEASFPAGL